MFKLFDKQLGNYVKYSKSTLKHNPSMIKNEYKRIINEKRNLVNTLKGKIENFKDVATIIMLSTQGRVTSDILMCSDSKGRILSDEFGCSEWLEYYIPYSTTYEIKKEFVVEITELEKIINHVKKHSSYEQRVAYDNYKKVADELDELLLEYKNFCKKL